MGSTPSSTKTAVQEIHLDQSGSSNSSNRRASADGRVTLASMSARLRKSTSSLGTRTASEKDRKLANLQSQLDCAENQKMETQRLVQVLQREVSGLELRNNELVEEVAWLKDQIGAFPETPSPSSEDRCQITRRKSTMQDAFRMLTEEHENLKAKSRMDKDLYENLVHKLQNELKEQNECMRKRINFEQDLRLRMEEVIKKDLGESYLFNVKDSFARDVNTEVIPEKSNAESKPLCRNMLPSRTSTPQEHAEPHGNPSPVQIDVKSSTFTAFTTKRRSLEEHAGDDIDALLMGDTSSSPANCAGGKEDLTEGDHAGIPNAVLSSKPSRNLSNVFTLSDAMEPLRVVDSPPVTASSYSGRPATAGQIGDIANSQDALESEKNCNLDRGDSVPALHSRSRQVRRSRMVPATDQFEVASITEEKYLDDLDEGVDDILNASLRSVSTLSKGRRASAKKSRDSGSAKSRDSGFLGDSANFSQIESS